MWRLFSFLIFVVLVIAVIGYFRGWVHFSASHNDGNTNVHINVNGQSAKHDAHEAEQKVKQGVRKFEKDFDHERAGKQ